MPGVNNWSPIQPEMVWTKVASALRHELGEGPYNSYVAPSALRQNPLGDPVLVTPTLYARDWFARNALRRANELWAQHDPDHRSLELKSRAEFDDQSKAAAPTPVSRVDSAEGAAVAPVVSFQDAAARVAGLQERLTFDTFVRVAAMNSPILCRARSPRGPTGILIRSSSTALTAMGRLTF